MDCSFSASYDDSEEPLTPVRSPSRLDFCIQDIEDLESRDMDWPCSPFRDDWPLLEEETFPVDIAVPDDPRLRFVEDDEDESPVAGSQATDNTDISHASTELDCSMDHTGPQAPIPVRPPEVEFQVDSQEQPMPSRIAPQRLNYTHHGLSRSALLQRKTLWNSRHEEWIEWQSRQHQGNTQKPECETDHAYTGLASARSCVPKIPPYMRTPPSGLERDFVDHPPKKQEQDIYSPIYPRVGDISALRDPYAANIDRCFFRCPLWTLHKTLYVFNMQQRADPYTPVSATTSVESSLSSSSTLSSYTSFTHGDGTDSDTNLVAEVSPAPPSQGAVEEPPKPTLSPHTFSSWNNFCGWEISWYARWEVLIGLFQRNAAKHEAHEIAMINADMSYEPKVDLSTSTSPSGRVFKFTVGEDEENAYNDDDDDDEDYGTLISHSNFNVNFSDEECERAVAFYRRSESATY